MKVLVLFLVGLSISACSGGGSLDVSKSDETSITKFEGLKLSEFVEKNHQLLAECNVYGEEEGLRRYIKSDTVWFSQDKKVLEIKPVMYSGQIKLYVTYKDILQKRSKGNYSSNVVERFELVGTYKIDDAKGVASIFIYGYEVADFTYAGTFNEQPTLKVNFKSAISSVVPFGNTEGFFERPVLFSANKQGSIRFGAFDQDAQYLCDKTPNKIF